MNVHIIFVFTFVFLSHCVKSDDSEFGLWLCHGEKHGTLLPSPFDCGSYYVCDGSIPLIKKCDAGLHFDPLRHVCNWPEAANCQIGNEPSTFESPKPTEPTTKTAQPTTITSTTPRTTIRTTTTTTPRTTTTAPTTVTTTQSSTTMSTTTEAICSTFDPSTNLIPSTTTLKPFIPPPFLGAYDQESGSPIDSMTGFNPNSVQCIHLGLYFLPHPLKCDAYYICSQGYPHLHHCGSGVHWNYRAEQCEISVISRCYYKEALANGTITTKMPSTREPTVSTTQRTTVTKQPPSPPTPPTHSHSTQTTIKTPTTITTNGPNEEILPVCPIDRRAYYPHPFDCRKYYNCIGGTPILTICPNNLYWNEHENSCSLPEYTTCKSDQNNII